MGTVLKAEHCQLRAVASMYASIWMHLHTGQSLELMEKQGDREVEACDNIGIFPYGEPMSLERKVRK